MPELPVSDDNATANEFFFELTALTSATFWSPVPDPVDDGMVITVGVRLVPCDAAGSNNCPAPFGQRFAASMNNVSFEPATRLSLLQAFFDKVDGIYTNDFPDEPPEKFDYTNQALGTVENHPIHLHGYDFHILAQGVGNYDPQRDVTNYNLKNPQIRNTVAVPIGGWAAIRFRANNPGMWFIHCHLEVDMPWGLSAAFAVENGPTPSTSLPPPPPNLRQC
ncbi:oxidase [Lithospermum erythrorhizon]|uniref:Oxidase n=1 Tax=Lithospermum erythrorhizon TaxID=34254 RepID=A0AAV3PYR0_LITER